MATNVENNKIIMSFTNLVSAEFTPFITIDEGDERIIKLDSPDNMTKTVQCIAKTFYGNSVCTKHVFSYGDYCLEVALYNFDAKEVSDGFILEMRFTNKSKSPINLLSIGMSTPRLELADGKFYVSGLNGDLFCGSFDDELPPHRHNNFGDTDWCMIYKRVESGEDGIFLSPTGNPEAFIKYNIFALDDKTTASMEFYSEMDGVLVESGETRGSQSIVCLRGDFLTNAKRVMGEMAITHGSRTRYPNQLGWCSWYDKAQNITQGTISTTLTAIEEHKDELRLDFIQIDDGYQVCYGDWRPNEKFPDGFRWFTERVSAIGARPGIWMALCLVSKNTDFFKEHPEAFSRRADGGFMISGGEPNFEHALDMTHPEAHSFIRRILKEKVDDGFTYFKFDFNHIKVDGRCAYDPRKTSLQAYRQAYKLYRECIGEDAYMLSCSDFQRATFGYADASRVGTDSCCDWNDGGCSLPGALRDCKAKSIANGLIYSCDPDVTYTDVRRDAKEPIRRMWHSFVGLFGGLVATSDPIENRINKIDMLKKVEPTNAEQAEDVFPCTDTYPSRYGFVSKRFGGFGSYLMLNRFDVPRVIDTCLHPLDELGEKFHCWSFWDEKYLGIKTAYFDLEQDASSCQLLRFTPVKDEAITLIGSTLHVTMGAGEFDLLLSTDDGVTVVLNDKGASNGALYFVSRAEEVAVQAENCSTTVEKQGDVFRLSVCGRLGYKQKITLTVK